MRFIELFAGIGGFRYGLESVNRTQNQKSKRDKEAITKIRQRLESTPRKETSNKGRQYEQYSNSNTNSRAFTSVYANEWDKYAGEIYRRNYGQIDRRDITTVQVGEIPDHDLLTAGFPCQAFSIAGKREGFDDTRGTLFFEIVRILQQKYPSFFILENVKGLLSHSKGETFYTILQTLDELGYDLQWQVLNSKNFGVPQNRERVFIVGNLRGIPRPEIFPITRKNEATLEYVTAGGIDKRLEDGKNLSRNHSQGQRVYSEEGIASTLHANAGGWGGKTGLYTVQDNKLLPRKIVNTLDANYYKGLDNHQQRTGVMEGTRIRRLTPLECERLQGFPAGWTEGVSDTQRYKMLGNAVTTNVIKAIGERL